MKKKLRDLLACLLAITLIVSGIVPMQVQAADKVDYSAVFDANYYYSAYADLRAAVGNDKSALLQHFIAHGMQEGRRGNDEFDVKAYMQNNSDLVKAFGTEDLTSYYLHYINYGKKEGRIATSGNAGSVAEINLTPAVSTQTLISSYTTAYDPTQSRAVNIALAVSKLNGTVVQPGKEFSFSDAFGPRTAANGYVEAPTFVSGKTVLGVGGGICQVSSTAYAAMLQGGIIATQRYPHSKPVSYIPVGMDATIVAGQKDLKFVNTYEYPIIINASVTPDGTVTVSFSK